jgi:hypothetical protein
LLADFFNILLELIQRLIPKDRECARIKKLADVVAASLTRGDLASVGVIALATSTSNIQKGPTAAIWKETLPD